MFSASPVPPGPPGPGVPAGRGWALLAAGGLLAGLTAGLSAPAGAATATPGQHAYVAFVNDTSGTDTYPDTQAQVLARIDAGLARWVTESDGLIPSFTRAGGTPTFDADCSQGSAQSASWAASGQLFPGVSFSGTSGNHLIVVAPQSCGGGVGTVGGDAGGLGNGGKVYLDDNPGKGTQSELHELGHNFSLQHAHAVTCDTSGSCTQADYGDDYAIMGATIVHTPAFVPASFDSFERTHLGIAQPCEVPVLALAAGQHSVTATYDLFGRGSTSTGVRGLALTDPTSGGTTMLDWRDHAGRDAGAYYGTSLALAQREALNAGLTVEQLAADGDSSILQGHLADGRTYAATAASTYLHAYTAGQAYTAGGTTVHVDAMPAGNGTDATTQVTVTLADGSTAAAPALPAQAGAAAINGSAPGSTLTAVPTGWTTGSCYRYQWSVDGVPVDGARSSTFTAPGSGHTVSVTITGQQTGYRSLTTTSPPTTATDPPAGPPAPTAPAPTAPAPTAPASTAPAPSTSPASPTSPTVRPVPTQSPTPVAAQCNPTGSTHTPSFLLDGGGIRYGARKGITARCLRPGRIVKVFVTEAGHERKLTQVVVNRFGTVRVFYRATTRGPVVLHLSGAEFTGPTLRQTFRTTVR